MNVLTIIRYSLAILLSVGLAYHGKKKKSLSNDGAVGAVIVGFISFACSYRYGILLILFYYSSSKFTKVREDVKARLEEGHLAGGQRSIIQVFSCSILATIVAVVYMFYCSPDKTIDFTPSYETVMLPGGFVFDKRVLSSYLSCLYIAHYATATGDTWSSELGILSRYHPRLITSFLRRTVPPGTNGGMSLLGTAASVVGGAFIGAVFYLYDILFLTDESPRIATIYLAAFCGLLGSILDSLLGATLQITYYSKSKKCIVKKKTSADHDVIRICGADILSNESVNFLSILMTMILSVWLAPVVFEVL